MLFNPERCDRLAIEFMNYGLFKYLDARYSSGVQSAGTGRASGNWGAFAAGSAVSPDSR